MNYKRNKKGYFGEFGGQFMPETLMQAIIDLEKAYAKFQNNQKIQDEFKQLLENFVGRPTPLYYAQNLSKKLSQTIYLKREDLAHTGAHKINNALGQCLLAKYMGKKRIIAETGAGQHGVATAAAAAMLNMECVIYMGKVDMERQKPNVQRIRLMGAKIVPVLTGSQTLKDSINEAIRDWITNIKTTHYLLGSVLGPHPYPTIVRDFQSIIGKESKSQILSKKNRLPDYLIACVGGGSNSIGLFSEFLKNKKVQMIGVEAGGKSIKPGMHAARFSGGRVGILHGAKSFVLQDRDGQILTTHSVSAGLDYPSVGPEHSHLRKLKRINYDHVNDQQALLGFKQLSKLEGIIPALESAHAIGYLFEFAKRIKKDQIIIVNLSGRGDKDLETVLELKHE